MLQFIVIFSLSVTGSLVALSAELAHRFLMRKARPGLMAADSAPGAGRHSARVAATVSAPTTDPVVTFGSILACYGAFALALVCALPAPLALERTVLTFAILCVGGLLGEIAKSGSSLPPDADPDAVDDPAPPRAPPSRGLSFTLALVLNLAFAVLGSGQALIDIVPPSLTARSDPQAQQLQPILVVAQRAAPPRDDVRGSQL